MPSQPSSCASRFFVNFSPVPTETTASMGTPGKSLPASWMATALGLLAMRAPSQSSWCLSLSGVKSVGAAVAARSADLSDSWHVPG